MVAGEAQKRESDVLQWGNLQGCMWELGDVLDLRCCMAGQWNMGTREEAALRVFSLALVMWGELGRGGGGTHRPLPSAKLAGNIAKSWCFGRSTAVTLSLRLIWPL